MDDLFGALSFAGEREILTEGAVILRGFVASNAAELLESVVKIAAVAPFRNMMTPGGRRMSVAMTNCGKVGWVTDKKGYRYDPCDPESGAPWPPMPVSFAELATDAAASGGFPRFEPDVCLINRYEPGAKLSLHQDRDEQDFGAPIVSVSLGLPAKFLFGGASRWERPR